MTDPRPSENTDDIPQWPGFRAAGFFDDLPTGSVEELRDWDGAPIQETADAQHIVAAIDRLSEQQRIGNLIAWQALTGESNRAQIREGLGI